MDEAWYMWAYRTKQNLHNKPLVYLAYQDDGHAHCEICWARFSKHSDDLHAGYYEMESCCWICADCFAELAGLFNWSTNQGDGSVNQGDGSAIVK